MAEPSTAPATEEASLTAQVPPPVRSLTRSVVAIVVAGVVAALTWLVVVQEAGKRGYTDLDVNHALGEVIRGPVDTGRVRSDDALGVIGDPVAPTGFRVALIAGILILALHALVAPRLSIGRWYLRALPLALVVFLLTAFVYAPLVESRGVASAGVLGLGAGAGTPLVFLAGALAFGIAGARVHELMAGSRWWEPKEEDLGVASLEAVVAASEKRGETSLELAEEGSEKRREGPGA